MSKPLKILMMLHMPWDRNLGAPRVQLELAEEFRKRGHQVEKYAWADAFPRESRLPFWRLLQPHIFTLRAIAFVRRHGAEFDVIEANQGNLPISKQALGFKGLLVARSNGLYAFYDEFTRIEQSRRPPLKRLKAGVREWALKISGFDCKKDPPRSLQEADLIVLLNEDEVSYVTKELGLGAKCRLIHLGLSEERLQKFAALRASPESRLAAQTVAFVGAWSIRKGSKEWGKIVRRVRSECPDARFLFLGTGLGAEVVQRDLELPECDWIRIVPSFASAELPELLAAAAVGAFPSYIEGFPFGVLEKLAAGLPVAAYDVPGPREMLKELPNQLLTPLGDTESLGAKVSSLLKLPLAEYARLSKDCEILANKYRWLDVAERTLQTYEEALAKLETR